MYFTIVMNLRQWYGAGEIEANLRKDMELIDSDAFCCDDKLKVVDLRMLGKIQLNTISIVQQRGIVIVVKKGSYGILRKDTQVIDGGDTKDLADWMQIYKRNQLLKGDNTLVVKV